MEQKERMDQGLIYDPADNRISTEQTSCLDAQYEFNATRPSEMKKRAALLKQMLGAIGENCYIEPPFRANWGGKHDLSCSCHDDAPLLVLGHSGSINLYHLSMTRTFSSCVAR